MFQVVALYAACEEVGYGEGETYEYAMQECVDTVPAIYPSEDVVLHARKHGGMEVSMPLDLYKAFC